MEQSSFKDANGVTVRPGDEVEYRFGARRAKLVEVFHDGDASVQFHDGSGHTETVKFKHLCRVPEGAAGMGTAAAPKRSEEPIDRKAVAERLIQLRDAFSRTQVAMAEFVGLDPRTLNNYELGISDLSLKVAVRIVAATGVTLDWLYLGDPRLLPENLAVRLEALAAVA